MKKKVVFLSLFFVSFVLFSEKPVFSLIDITGKLPADKMAIYNKKLSKELENTVRYRYIPVTERNRLLKEAGIDPSTLTSEKQQRKAGRALKTDIILTGYITNTGTSYLIKLKIIKTVGPTLKIIRRTYTTTDQLFSDIPPLARLLKNHVKLPLKQRSGRKHSPPEAVSGSTP